jgi:hypothetical protein
MLHFLLAVAWIFQPAQQPTAGKASPPVEVSPREADQHRIGDPWLFIRVNTEHPEQMRSSYITFEVVVGPTGAVVSATAQPPDRSVKMPADALPRAESAVRALRYQPFEREGHAVTAKLAVSVRILPPERRALQHVPFPIVKDWKSVKITLQRNACYERCPSYSVEVHGDGSIFYVGKSNVAVTGHHRAQVPRDKVFELVKLFEQADYYSLLDVYDEALLDSATEVTSIEIDGRRKQVKTWEGAVAVGMPLAVSEIELAIDRLSGSARWTRGNAENTGHR